MSDDHFDPFSAVLQLHQMSYPMTDDVLVVLLLIVLLILLSLGSLLLVLGAIGLLRRKIARAAPAETSSNSKDGERAA